MLTSKIISEIIDNHSEFAVCAHSRNKFLSIRKGDIHFICLETPDFGKEAIQFQSLFYLFEMTKRVL